MIRSGSGLLGILAVLFVVLATNAAAQQGAAPTQVPTTPATSVSSTNATPRFNPMTQYDANKDGKVSQEEYLASATKRFQDMDTNKDGVLTQEEFTAGRRGMGGRQGGDQQGGRRGERGEGR